jgi:hypothetical protein
MNRKCANLTNQSYRLPKFPIPFASPIEAARFLYAVSTGLILNEIESYAGGLGTVLDTHTNVMANPFSEA